MLYVTDSSIVRRDEFCKARHQVEYDDHDRRPYSHTALLELAPDQPRLRGAMETSRHALQVYRILGSTMTSKMSDSNTPTMVNTEMSMI